MYEYCDYLDVIRERDRLKRRLEFTAEELRIVRGQLQIFMDTLAKQALFDLPKPFIIEKPSGVNLLIV
jgi:hypothetical protein